MMKSQIAGIVLAASVVGGIGTGVLANALTDERPVTADPGPSVTTSAAPEGLTLAPGAVGPVKVGMSKQEALATGYFVADAVGPAEGCPVLPLTWKDAYVNTYDVYTLGNGEIASIGVRGDGVATEDGIGVGSTYDEVAAQYPDDKLVEAGYGQSGIRFLDGENGGWIGFLFDAAPDVIEGSDAVTFVEVTKGHEPSLMRDGC